ncbi:hypothetical protein PVA45_01395 [Entomospira entomophila]|uniref:Uncharacterized protein n=1 Tax=Entomospira entomophila TaxID=2719988 RepID=A0A968KSB6_9SPIO|nr:hypothetical protein [Entomospira entomophilus]NIZ40172.1 hypothetical protein [Entomospira entomophilus]WDI35730.1 hypothetical protein PVA45_01395 [Entomospira entomophilus]
MVDIILLSANIVIIIIMLNIPFLIAMLSNSKKCKLDFLEKNDFYSNKFVPAVIEFCEERKFVKSELGFLDDSKYINYGLNVFSRQDYAFRVVDKYLWMRGKEQKVYNALLKKEGKGGR